MIEPLHTFGALPDEDLQPIALPARGKARVVACVPAGRLGELEVERELEHEGERSLERSLERAR
jgi:hypothetical protein